MYYFKLKKQLVSNRKLVLFPLFVLSLFISSQSFASPYYGELGVMRTTVQVESTEFNLVIPKVKFGYIYKPQVLFELQISGSANVNQNNSNMKVSGITAAYVRLGSKPDQKLRFYFLAGAATTALETTGVSGIKDSYASFSWAAVMEKSFFNENNAITLEYNNYYNFDDVGISGFTLAYKYTF